MWSLEEIQELVRDHTSTKIQKELVRETRKWKTTESVVFGLPRSSGGWVIFGVMFKGIKGAHPLIPGSSVKEIIPIRLQRLDREYLMMRGGSHYSLSNKCVAVVGCGSVGATIAIELARSGIGQLTLIDNDILTPDNVFRHPVGYYRIGIEKVSALKDDLEMRIPYVQVATMSERIETLLQKKKMSLPNYDLIVVATGEPSINLFINELLHCEDRCPPALFAWLDPCGIGGHVLLQYANGRGCLQCLYEFTDEGHLNNRASFVKPGQSFLKDIAGCGTLFTPFGAIDVVQTSQEAVRLALAALTTGSFNQIVSWKGDASTFLKEGYQLSDRYSHEKQMLDVQCTEFMRVDCSICNGL